MAPLATGGDRIGGPGSLISWRPGELWAMALVGNDREDDCYRWVARLSERTDEVGRRAGIDMAHVAMRQWRAAPSRVAPMVVPALAGGRSALRQAAALALGASLEASRTFADSLANQLSEPDPRLCLIVTLALARIGDAPALPGTCALIQAGSTDRGLRGAVTRLTGGVVDPSPLVDAARQVPELASALSATSDKVTETIGTINPATAVTDERVYIRAFFDKHARPVAATRRSSCPGGPRPVVP